MVCSSAGREMVHLMKDWCVERERETDEGVQLMETLAFCQLPRNVTGRGREQRGTGSRLEPNMPA